MTHLRSVYSSWDRRSTGIGASLKIALLAILESKTMYKVTSVSTRITGISLVEVEDKSIIFSWYNPKNCSGRRGGST